MQITNDQQKKIREEYEKSLQIPKHKPSQQYMLCPIGIIGSGKSTFIKPLAEKLSLVRIWTDGIRILLKQAPWPNNFDTEAPLIATQLISKYLDLGYSIAIDGDCVSDYAQDLITQRQKEYKLKIIWLHINTPEKFILEKLRNTDYSIPGPFDNSEDSIKNYFGRKLLHQSPDMPFSYIFDASRPDITHQIEEAAKKIDSEIHR